MGALSHLRIVEIGSAAAASYCARLFADFGATVQKVEPPQGDRSAARAKTVDAIRIPATIKGVRRAAVMSPPPALF